VLYQISAISRASGNIAAVPVPLLQGKRDLVTLDGKKKLHDKVVGSHLLGCGSIVQERQERSSADQFQSQGP
jgi:hypothetical protein